MVDWFCFKLGRNYYSQTFLEECKYKTKEQVLKSFINEDVENSDDDDDDDDDSKEWKNEDNLEIILSCL